MLEDYAETISSGPVTLYSYRGEVTKDGQLVHLTAHEFKTLRFLMHRRGRIVSREELREVIYTLDFGRDSNTIDVFIHRIRRKLGSDMITTKLGLGFIHDKEG